LLSRPAGHPAKTIGDALRHRGRSALGVVVAAVLIASVLVVFKPKSYDANALLFVDERHNSSQGFDLALQAGELMSHHYLQMATSRPVLQDACFGPESAQLPVGTQCDPTQLAQHVQAGLVTGTSLITVKVSASSPAAAAALANAVANAIVAQDRQQIASMLAPTKTHLDSELQRLDTAMLSEKDPAKLTLLLNEHSTEYTQRQNLTLEEDRLDSNLSVLETALPPTKPADPDPFRYLLVGLIAGAAGGLVLALVLEYFDDRLREPEQLARAAGTPVVVRVPNARRGGGGNGSANPYGVAFASLLALQPRLRKVLVTAASADDPAEVAASDLAMEAVYHSRAAAADEFGAQPPLPPAAGPDAVRVVAAPSPDVSSRYLSLAGSADLAVLVATVGVTRFGAARRTAELLRHAGADVAVGILMPKNARDAANRSEPQR
jgi:capsular polysaccharide biosynthesis protein